jgi:small-conductance mechanosensitive channel
MHIYITKYSEKLKTDPTNFSFLKNSVGFIIFTSAIIFIFYKIPYLKSIGTALFAGAGIVAVIVGFASQKAFSNIISGVFILVFKPFKISDIIEFKDGQKGVVEEITLRHTMIKDYENRRIVIPNSMISDETIINSNIQDEKIRKHILFSISYDSNIDLAIRIIKEEAENHPLVIDNRSPKEKEDGNDKVMVRVIALGDFSVDLKAFVWTAGNDEAFVVKCDLLKSVKERFDREGIEIPFPYRTIVYKKDLNPNASEEIENLKPNKI